MLIGESDAKKLWCPFSRVLPDLVVATGTPNRGYQMGGALENCRCLGSGCAAWRWAAEFDGTFNTHLTGPHLETTSKTPNLRRSDRGYCGLAGRPEVVG